ncbi:MAG: hypothetical protein J6W90_05075 [Verrucomicrobia bacterium]|nr:hypothetical protein [Verrucomicrobiota bacterium]
MSKNNLKEFWVMKEPVGVIYQQLIEFAQRFSSSILFEFLELGKTDLSKVPDFFKDLLHLEAIQFTSSNKSEYATQQTLARCKISDKIIQLLKTQDSGLYTADLYARTLLGCSINTITFERNSEEDVLYIMPYDYITHLNISKEEYEILRRFIPSLEIVSYENRDHYMINELKQTILPKLNAIIATLENEPFPELNDLKNYVFKFQQIYQKGYSEELESLKDDILGWLYLYLYPQDESNQSSQNETEMEIQFVYKRIEEIFCFF